MSELVPLQGPNASRPRPNAGHFSGDTKTIIVVGLTILIVAIGAFFAGQSTRRTDDQAKAALAAAKTKSVDEARASIRQHRSQLSATSRQRVNSSFLRGKTAGFQSGQSDGIANNSAENTTAYNTGRHDGAQKGWDEGLVVYHQRGY